MATPTIKELSKYSRIERLGIKPGIGTKQTNKQSDVQIARDKCQEAAAVLITEFGVNNRSICHRRPHLTNQEKINTFNCSPA